jgi:hypothetical protein
MPATLIRRPTSTTPPETNGDLVEDLADGDEQGRGESNGNARKPPRRRTKPAASEKSSPHKLTLRDSVFNRLEFHAIKRGSTASAIAEEILDRQLPRYKLVTDD